MSSQAHITRRAWGAHCLGGLLGDRRSSRIFVRTHTYGKLRRVRCDSDVPPNLWTSKFAIGWTILNVSKTAYVSDGSRCATHPQAGFKGSTGGLSAHSLPPSSSPESNVRRAIRLKVPQHRRIVLVYLPGRAAVHTKSLSKQGR